MTGDANTPALAVREMAMGYIRARALYAVAKLGVADHIDDQSVSITELAGATEADEAALYRVLRALAGSDVFCEGDDRSFSHTPQSRLLRADHPQTQRPGVIYRGEVLYEAYDEILHSLRTGEPGFNRRFNETFYDHLNSNEAVNTSFQEGLKSDFQIVLPTILKAYDFSGFNTIVDVGGGQGTLLSAILAENITVSGVLFDLETTVELAKSGAGGSLPRCEFVGGSFFEEIPKGGDLYILKHILHNWYDAEALSILRNCRRAMANNAKLIVIDPVIAPPNQYSMGNTMDINMLVIVGGLERRKEELEALLERADFKLDRVVETDSYVFILEAQTA